MPGNIKRTYSLIVAEIENPNALNLWPALATNGEVRFQLEVGSPAYPVRVILYLSAPVLQKLQQTIQILLAPGRN